MKEYIKRIKIFSKQLKSSAVWHNSNKSISNIKTSSENDKDYVYEFFVYLCILKDLEQNYNLKYYPGKNKKKGLFPKNPVPKKDTPFFYIEHKVKSSEKYQVCAGTQIQSRTTRKRAPDISFQAYTADLDDPLVTDVFMIYDTKRKRPNSKSQQLSDGQYSFFFKMAFEFGLVKPISIQIDFNQFKSFVGNCLITNKKAFSGILADNIHFYLKEVEYFDETINVKKINVIG